MLLETVSALLVFNHIESDGGVVCRQAGRRRSCQVHVTGDGPEFCSYGKANMIVEIFEHQVSLGIIEKPITIGLYNVQGVPIKMRTHLM
jgi:hypothetical protein